MLNTKSFRLMSIALLWSASFTGLSQLNIDHDFPEFRFTIPHGQFKELHTLKGDKLSIKNPQLILNDDSVHVKDLHFRGNNSLNFKRKSLSVDLKKTIRVTLGDDTVSLKKFDLVNLVMDKNLWHNRWSFLMMSELGVFPLINSYCTVNINDEPQGIYLLIEKPQYSIAGRSSLYMLRRGLNERIDKEYKNKATKQEVKDYRKQFHSLYNVGSLHGKELYDHLNNIINLENYFTWIAFNYLIMNGDYTDELFLYINPESKRYEVIAWDYDDLLKPHPHEGQETRNAKFPDRLIFSLEDDFDHTIAKDDYLYHQYLKTLKEVLTKCDNSLLNSTSQKTSNELKTLSIDPQNGLATKYLDQEPFNIEDAIKDIEGSIQFMESRKVATLNSLP